MPVDQRIHIWLGGKPIDWSKIETKEDLAKVTSGQADLYTADLIEEQILSRHKKALIVYGTVHIYDKGSLTEYIWQRHLSSIFVITPYAGFPDKFFSEHFESSSANWPVAALIGIRQLTTNHHATPDESCNILDASGFAEMTEEQRAMMRADMESRTSVLVGDALFYLAPARTLTKPPLSPDLYLDSGFHQENDRRAAPLGGLADPWPTVKDNPVSPLFLHDYGVHSAVPAK